MIVLTSTIHPKLIRSNGTLAIGSCDDESKTIYINENLSPERMKKVLCHEITHAATLKTVDESPLQCSFNNAW